MSNLSLIKEKGVNEFLKLQGERICLLEAMIENYDEGRSKSFFCRAAALLEPAALKASLDKAKASIGAGSDETIDTRYKAKVLRAILAEAALRSGTELNAKK